MEAIVESAEESVGEPDGLLVILNFIAARLKLAHLLIYHEWAAFTQFSREVSTKQVYLMHLASSKRQGSTQTIAKVESIIQFALHEYVEPYWGVIPYFGLIPLGLFFSIPKLPPTPQLL